MDLKEIQNLIKFVAKSGASEVKLEMDDIKITIKTGSDSEAIEKQIPAAAHIPPTVIPTALPVAAPAPQEPAAPAPADDDSKYITIKSPHSIFYNLNNIRFIFIFYIFSVFLNEIFLVFI